MGRSISLINPAADFPTCYGAEVYAGVLGRPAPGLADLVVPTLDGRMSLSTQLSIDAAMDDELLSLAACPGTSARAALGSPCPLAPAHDRAAPMPLRSDRSSAAPARDALRSLGRGIVVLALLFAGPASSPGCGDGSARPSRAEELAGHQRMLAELRRVADDVMGGDRFLGDAQLGSLQADLDGLPAIGGGTRRHELLVLLGVNLLRLGRTQESLDRFAEAEALLPGLPEADRPRAEVTLLFHQALAWLRLGENANCVGCANPDSCLFPIRGGGLHVDAPEGSREAVELLTRLLDHPRCPEGTALTARWLLNIASMTLGTWPDGVPERWRIEPEVFEGAQGFPRFPQIAAGPGLATLSLSGGAVVDDLDGDGLLDVLVSTWHYDGEMHFFHNAGDGGFVDRTTEANLRGLLGGLNMEHTDYDGDGDLDVLVLRGAWFDALGRHPNSLLRNEGDGTFLDVTYQAGLGDAAFPTQTCAFADYDLDGDLDLYIGNEDSERRFFPSQLFRSRGDGTFADVAREAGVENLRYAKGVAWGDHDDDGDPDLYVSNLAGDNRLYRNQGDGSFVDTAQELGVARPAMSFPTWFWDVDNDGHLDLYVAAYVEDVAEVAASWLGLPHEHEAGRLYLNDRHGGFVDRTEAWGLSRVVTTMGANFGDLDDDGWLDMYLGTGFPSYAALMPNVMYRNVHGTRFEDVSAAGGFGHLQKGHAVAFADLDNDGDQDVFEEMGGAYAGDRFLDALYENPGFGRHWLRLELLGMGKNRRAVGARVSAEFEEGGVLRSVHRVVGTGGSFGSSPLAVHLGLGEATRLSRVVVRWPDGAEQEWTDLPLDAFVQLEQGRPGHMLLERAAVSLRRPE